MTVAIDLERVGAVTAQLRRNRAVLTAIAEHLAGVGRRMHLDAEVAAGVAFAERVAGRLHLTDGLLTHLAEQARRADTDVPAGGHRSFAGGSVLCSAIQLVSPIPSQPSTGGVTGAIDAAGVARDAAGIADAGSATIAGRSVPAAAVAAVLVDVALCRLGVGSGAGISTRKIVDEHGDEVYEGSRSDQPFMDEIALPLRAELEARDRQMWNAEHRNVGGYVTELYPGYPAYAVNAPRR